MQYIPAIIFAIVLIVIAFFLNRGKGLCLIAGFNTMPDEQRKGYDMKAVGKFVSKILMGMALCLLAFDFGWYMDNTVVMVLPWIAFGGIVIFALAYLNGNRFKKK